jgi:hypothetical protein
VPCPLRVIVKPGTICSNIYCCGRALAQTVSHRFPTATSRVRAQVSLCGIYGGQSGTGAGFLLVLRFLLPILIPPTAPHSSLSSGAGTIGQLVAEHQAESVSPHAEKLKEKLLLAIRERMQENELIAE